MKKAKKQKPKPRYRLKKHYRIWCTDLRGNRIHYSILTFDTEQKAAKHLRDYINDEAKEIMARGMVFFIVPTYSLQYLK